MAFITAIAVCAMIFALLSLWAGYYHFDKFWQEFNVGKANRFAQDALLEGYRKHLTRNIAILVVSLCWLIFGTDWFFDQADASEPVEVEVAMPPRVSRPEHCSQFLYQRTEDEWNEERQEYWPPNHQWEECMGVERK